MKRILIFTAFAIASVGAGVVSAQEETMTVRVMSRTWAVTQVSQEPVVYRATRDWNNLNPYGPPARLRTHQAIAAVQQATGCTVDRNTLYQNISGQFFARVTCR